MRFSMIIFVLMALSACATATTQSTSAPPTNQVQTPTPVLEFAELKILQNNKLRVLIHADGSVVKADGTVLGKMTANGKWIKPDGTLLATLSADGAILDSDGQSLGVTIDADGVFSSEDKSVSFNDDGTLSNANPDGPELKVDGLTPATRRCAMFFLMLNLTSRAASR